MILRVVIHTLFNLIALISLSACTNMNSSAQNNSDHNKQIATAKINVQLGMDYLQRKDIATAKQKLLLALKQDPNLPEAWYSMGYFFEATGNKLEARKYYLKSLALAPYQGEVQNNYGTFLCRNGEPKTAIQHFLIAVKDPNYLDTGAAYENAGLCALDIPNQNLAMTYFNQAVRQDPNRPMSLMELAVLSYKQGNYSASRSWLDSFLAVSPPTPSSIRLSGQLANKRA